MTPRFPWFAAFLVSVLLVVGCAGRRPATSSVPTVPPAPPATETTPPAPTRPPSPSGPSEPLTRSAPFIPGIYVEEGIASWYGVPFNGRRAADGEIFDMNTLVAAHRTLPFGSIVRVTNLSNGRQIDVRVIDRGPFVGNRVLDLARAAAAGLDMIGTGTAPVRIELIASPSTAGGEYTVQVGAFADRDKAERLRQRLLAKYQPIYLQEFDAPGGHFFRVRVGSFSIPDDAQQLAAQLRKSDGFQTFVLRLDLPGGLNVK